MDIDKRFDKQDIQLDKLLEMTHENSIEIKMLASEVNHIKYGVGQIPEHHDRITKLECATNIQKNVLGWVSRNFVGLAGMVVGFGAWAHSLLKT